MISIGVDIEDVNRFINRDKKFLERIFTVSEINYCIKFANSAPHFAARYCAKEAVVKALSNLYPNVIPYSKIEVKKNENGSVYIDVLIDELKKYNYSLSISHEKEKAVAMVCVEY